MPVISWWRLGLGGMASAQLDQLGPRIEVQLAEQVRRVALDRARREEQTLPDLPVREALADEEQDVHLPAGEPSLCSSAGTADAPRPRLGTGAPALRRAALQEEENRESGEESRKVRPSRIQRSGSPQPSPKALRATTSWACARRHPSAIAPSAAAKASAASLARPACL